MMQAEDYLCVLQELDDQICMEKDAMIVLVVDSQNMLSEGNEVFVSPERHKETYRVTCRLLLALEERMRALAPLFFRLTDLQKESMRMMAETDAENEAASIATLAKKTELVQARMMELRRLLASFSDRVDRAADLQHLGKSSSPDGVIRCMTEYIQALNRTEHL